MLNERLRFLMHPMSMVSIHPNSTHRVHPEAEPLTSVANP